MPRRYSWIKPDSDTWEIVKGMFNSIWTRSGKEIKTPWGTIEKITIFILPTGFTNQSNYHIWTLTDPDGHILVRSNDIYKLMRLAGKLASQPLPQNYYTGR